MSMQDRLVTIFKEPFQIKRVSKQIQNLREAKGKSGLQVKYTLTRGVHLTCFVEIQKQQLKKIKNLSFMKKLEFKVVLKNSYPSEPPKLYFLSQNVVDFGIHPFHNYLDYITPEWTPKITVIDIIKNVPKFILACIDRNTPNPGQAQLHEYFQTERLFTYPTIQSFPVRLLRNGQIFQGMLVVHQQLEIILLEQTSFQGSYSISEFIAMTEIQSLQKHKSKSTCAMIEIKKGGSRFGVEFYSDQYHNIISAISDAMKSHLGDKKKDDSDSSGDQEEEEMQIVQGRKPQNVELLITDFNIHEIEEQVLILQNMVDNEPTSKNIKELVELLKKTVEFYSVKGDQRCQMYLKSLQTIMGNEMMQVLLESEDPNDVGSNHDKREYESIADLI